MDEAPNNAATSRRILIHITRISFATVLLGLLLSCVDVRIVWEGLLRVSPLYMGLLVALFLLFTWVSAAQLRAILSGSTRALRVAHLAVVQLISGFYSTIMPAGAIAGMAATWWRLFQSSRQGVDVGLTILFLRLLDFSFLVLLCVVSAWGDHVIATANVRIILIIILAGTILAIAAMIHPRVRLLGTHMLRAKFVPHLPGSRLPTIALRVANALDSATAVSRSTLAIATIWWRAPRN